MSAVAIKQWTNYTAQGGAVLSLVYATTPPTALGWDDSESFFSGHFRESRSDRQFMAVVVAPRKLSGFSFAGIGALPDTYAEDMQEGYRRFNGSSAYGQNLNTANGAIEAFVITSDVVRLGDVIQQTIILENGARYELTQVLQWRANGSGVQLALAKAEDYAEDANAKSFIDWSAHLAVGTTSEILKKVLEALAPLFVPIVVGVILYKVGKDALEK